MANDLARHLRPAQTAVLTMEMQRGVIGDLANLPELAAEAAATGIVDRAADLLRAARAAGVPVVHCIFESPDAAELNAPILSAMARLPNRLAPGSEAAELVPELDAQMDDLIESRGHGVSPFGRTLLDATLRQLGISTVVVAGVSVNLGVLGLAIEAVNAGFRAVVATDAVCGLPRDYAEAVMRNSVALVATRASVQDIITAWGATPEG
jgi:nicotinamidase-related amidase